MKSDIKNSLIFKKNLLLCIKKCESYDKTLIDYYKKHNNLDLEILFNKNEKTFCFTYVTKVDFKLLQAINKQIEELGWK